MSSIKQRLEKVAYDYGHGSMQTTRPVYEMSDKELQRRIAYEKGEAGMRTGLGALSGALIGGSQGLMLGGPVGMGVGAVGGGLAGAGLGYGSQKLKQLEASREAGRRGLKTASLDVKSAILGDGLLGQRSRGEKLSLRKAFLGDGILDQKARGEKVDLKRAILGRHSLMYQAMKNRDTGKNASAAEYSVLFDKVASGNLGEHARQALYGICQTLEAPVTAEKTASVYDASNLSENDARKARLDQLLKR